VRVRALALAALLPAVPAGTRAQDSTATAATAPEAAPPAARRDRIAIADYLDLEDVQEPRLSPDGRQVIYTRRYVDKVADRWESALWIMNADGSRNRFLVTGSNARWSPDGTRIAYLARGGGEGPARSGQPDNAGTQVFVRWMDGEGATSQITRVTEAPSDLEWAPDGKSLAFRMLVVSKDEWKIPLPAAPKGATWTEAPRVVQRVRYRADRQGFVDDGYKHIFVVPADGGTPRQLTQGNWEDGEPSWAPDSKSILFAALRIEDAEYAWRESEVYRVDVATGAVTPLTKRKGPDRAPVPSPDGRLIAYTGFDESTDTWVDSKLYVMSADGSGVRTLTGSLDRTPQGVQWAPDGSGLYFNVDSEGSRNLYFASLKGDVRPVTRGAHVLTVTDIARGLAVGTVTTPQRPNDVVLLALKDARLKPLTAVNDDVLAGKRLATVEELWVPSVDGMRVQGWLVKPADFDPRKKYPLMLEIHGGPHAMYNVGFSFARQDHAANGYVLLYTNPRGSTGYGSAFGNAIKNAYPGKDFDDLMAAVDTVVGRGFVDERRMFVFGCSGGGVLTSWIVGHTDRFAAASANCPVTNWLSFVGTTDGPSWYRNFAKMPWEDPSEHLKRSPLMYVGNVKTPTMLMTGVNDLRTPMPQTEEFYQALKMRKVPTAMVRFNDEWHGTSSKPSNFMRTQLYLRSWFERWGGKEVAKVTSD